MASRGGGKGGRGPPSRGDGGGRGGRDDQSDRGYDDRRGGGRGRDDDYDDRRGGGRGGGRGRDDYDDRDSDRGGRGGGRGGRDDRYDDRDSDRGSRGGGRGGGRNDRYDDRYDDRSDRGAGRGDSRRDDSRRGSFDSKVDDRRSDYGRQSEKSSGGGGGPRDAGPPLDVPQEIQSLAAALKKHYALDQLDEMDLEDIWFRIDNSNPKEIALRPTFTKVLEKIGYPRDMLRPLAVIMAPEKSRDGKMVMPKRKFTGMASHFAKIRMHEMRQKREAYDDRDRDDDRRGGGRDDRRGGNSVSPPPRGGRGEQGPRGRNNEQKGRGKSRPAPIDTRDNTPRGRRDSRDSPRGVPRRQSDQKMDMALDELGKMISTGKQIEGAQNKMHQELQLLRQENNALRDRHKEMQSGFQQATSRMDGRDAREVERVVNDANRKFKGDIMDDERRQKFEIPTGFDLKTAVVQDLYKQIEELEKEASTCREKLSEERAKRQTAEAEQHLNCQKLMGLERENEALKREAQTFREQSSELQRALDKMQGEMKSRMDQYERQLNTERGRAHKTHEMAERVLRLDGVLPRNLLIKSLGAMGK